MVDALLFVDTETRDDTEAEARLLLKFPTISTSSLVPPTPPPQNRWHITRAGINVCVDTCLTQT